MSDTDPGAGRRVALVGVPYHLGHRDVSMGLGPGVVLAPDAVPARLAEEGIDATVSWVDLDEPGEDDPELDELDQMGRYRAHAKRIAALVSEARAGGRFPVVAAGNCSSSIGVVSGLADPGLALVWLDAHPDTHTPDTSPSGLFEGMPVAVIAGRCWRAWRERIPGFTEIPVERILMVGDHEYYSDAPPALGDVARPISAVVDPPLVQRLGFEAALGGGLDALAGRARRVYLHIDTDVIEPAEARASVYAAPGGMSVAEVLRTIEVVSERFELQAVSFSSYDPEVDPRMEPVAKELVLAAARAGV